MRARAQCRCAASARRKIRAGSVTDGWGEGDQLDQLIDPPTNGGTRQAGDLERLGQQFGDRHARVERAGWVLEHDLHFAAVLAELAGRQRGQIRAVEHDPPGGRDDKLRDGAPDRGLAAAAFADQAQRLRGADREGNVVHGADDAVPVPWFGGADAVMHLQAFD